jgi:hypothetical protein
MLSVFLLAAGLLAAPAQADAAIAVFGDACVAATPATREGLSAQAAQRGWRPLRAQLEDGLEWRVIYQAGASRVRLDQHRASDGNPGERICVVLIGQASAGWRDQVSALVANGAPVGAPDTFDTERYQLPPELELTVWDLPDGSRIHALRQSDNLLELSINYPTGH